VTRRSIRTCSSPACDGLRQPNPNDRSLEEHFTGRARPHGASWSESESASNARAPLRKDDGNFGSLAALALGLIIVKIRPRILGECR